MSKKFELCSVCDGSGEEVIHNKYYGGEPDEQQFVEIGCRECNGERVVKVKSAWEIEAEAEHIAEMNYCYGRGGW